MTPNVNLILRRNSRLEGNKLVTTGVSSRLQISDLKKNENDGSQSGRIRTLGCGLRLGGWREQQKGLAIAVGTRIKSSSETFVDEKSWGDLHSGC